MTTRRWRARATVWEEAEVTVTSKVGRFSLSQLVSVVDEPLGGLALQFAVGQLTLDAAEVPAGLWEACGLGGGS